MATTIWSEDFCSKASSFRTSSAFGSRIDHAGIVDHAAGEGWQFGGKGGEGKEEERSEKGGPNPSPSREGGDRASVCGCGRKRAAAMTPPRSTSWIDRPLKGEGSHRAGCLHHMRRGVPYPPCFGVPKSTFGVSILSSATVKFWNGSLPVNQNVAQRIDGKVLKVVL